MKLVGTTEADFLRIAERSLFEVTLDSLDLLLGRTLLFRRNRVGDRSIIAILQNRNSRRDQLFVPAGKSAITQERLQKRSKSHRQRRGVRDGLEHIRHDAPLLEQSVIEGSDLRRDLISLEHWDARLLLFSGHPRKPSVSRTE